MEDEAYQQGRNARWAGYERDHNPYDLATRLYTCWDYGWTDQRDEEHTWALSQRASS